MAAESRSEVSGPVATMPGEGRSMASSLTTLMSRCPTTRSCTSRENTSRSTASAVPPGTRASSAQGSSTLPSARSSALSNPWALVRSTDLKELLQTSSARRSV
jgi:hypothetical protein